MQVRKYDSAESFYEVNESCKFLRKNMNLRTKL